MAPLGSSRPSGSLLSTGEFQDSPGPGRPRLLPADLQASLHSHSLSLAEPPEALCPPGSQAFLGFSRAPVGSSVGTGLPPGEDPGAPLASSQGAPQPLGTPRAAAVAVDNGFLPHSFLTVSPGHSGHHSPVLQGPGPPLPGQPPLPEKKRASEGDRSCGSASPSSSGFSSPRSGSTVSIPFPNVLPDFSRPPEATALSLGTCISPWGAPVSPREGPPGSHGAWEPAQPLLWRTSETRPSDSGFAHLLGWGANPALLPPRFLHLSTWAAPRPPKRRCSSVHWEPVPSRNTFVF